MTIFNTRLAGLLISVTALACTSATETAQSSAPERAPEAATSPALSSSASSEARATTYAGIPDSVKRLFTLMDAVGAGSETAYQKELAQFRADPQALTRLTGVYRQLPPDALGARWKTVEAAGQIHSPESVKFLEGVALGPAEIDPLGRGDAAGDRSIALRYTAALSVVRSHVRGVAGAETAVQNLVAAADPQVAQMVGVELFSAGKLTEPLRAALSVRAIATDFRKIEGKEREALTAVNPDAVHQGSDTRRRPRSTSVPPASAAQ